MNWQAVMNFMFSTVIFLCGLMLLCGAIFWRSLQMAVAGILSMNLVWLWRIEQLLVSQKQKKGKRHRVA